MTKLIRSPLFTGAGLAAALVAGLALAQRADANDPPGATTTADPAGKPGDGRGCEPAPGDEPGIAPGGCCEPEVVCKLPAPVQAEPALIEVVFVVDTTGSMGGLIEGAKRKVWSIANEILSAKPRPRLSVGMVAFRDYGDAYVTQVFQPTEDLDGVYANLQGFAADGGGDGPEHVNMALAAAFGLTGQDTCQGRCSHRRQNATVEPIRWSEQAKLKLVYLVGDAPAHRDYDQHVDFAKIIPGARQAQLTVNAVLCGGNGEARQQFTEIAQLGGGEFFEIAQSGGMTAVRTPHDEELRRLQRELEGTRLYYGHADKRRAAEASRGRAMDMDGEAGAARAAALSKAAPAAAPADDLVAEALAGEGEALAELADEELPDQLRGLSDEQREAKVKELAAQRQALQDRINAVVAQRDAYLREHQPKDGFDARVVESLKEDAAGIGLSWE